MPKLLRSPNASLSKETKTYVEMTTCKLRNLGNLVRNAFTNCNNLTVELRNALNKLKTLIDDRKIVVCKSDKDGKIIFLNYTDYNEIVIQELNKNLNKLNILPENISNHILPIKSRLENWMTKLHEAQVVCDEMPYHTTGMKRYGDNYQKTSGLQAKYFDNKEPGYIYPPFKTPKFTPKDLMDLGICKIPVRLLQSVGKIYTSRFTAFLEYLLQPISVKYCQSSIN